jgi:hypothetical protein
VSGWAYKENFFTYALNFDGSMALFPRNAYAVLKKKGPGRIAKNADISINVSQYGRSPKLLGS